jgi:hypothetical protein
MYLSVRNARRHLISLAGIPNSHRFTTERANEEVKAHYGSYPLDLAEIWFDLCHVGDDILPVELKLTKKEKSMRGFKQYAMAMFWLWTYPKNEKVFASRFDCSVRFARGKPLHLWVARIAALKVRKIKWDDEIDDPDGPTFCLTVDGTDFRQEEKQHPTYHRDEKEHTHKFKHCGCKFQLAISIWKSRVIAMDGPYRGGKSDNKIFLETLEEKIPVGKLVIADRGYRMLDKTKEKKLSMPRSTDSALLNNFKSRARARQECFNGRMKKFAVLSGEYFRHGGGADKGREFYGIVIEAVVVILQYQMDNGRELWAV